MARSQGDVSSWYKFVCNSGKVPVIAGFFSKPSWPLTEEFCRTTLLLHWPNWRKISDIKNDDVSWTEKFNEFIVSDFIPNFVKAAIDQAKMQSVHVNECDSNFSQSSEGNITAANPEWMDLIQPNAVYDDFTDEFVHDDGGPDYDWSASSHNYPRGFGINWLDNLNENATVSNVELLLPEVSISDMNREQRFTFNIIMETLLNYRRNTDDYLPLRMIVAGTAGSGRSFLIKCLVKAIRIFFKTNKCVQVLCPTGNSANLISGVTIHSFLKIPTKTKSREMSPPDGIVGESLQKNCDGVEVLLVDERSLVGSTTLGWMEFMCRCGIKDGENSSKSWGGLPVVVFFGDDIQLPPVCDFPVYKSTGKTLASLHGALVWKEFTTAVTLQTIVRQGNDQTQLKNVLTAMRTYNTTPYHAQWLQNFQWSNL